MPVDPTAAGEKKKSYEIILSIARGSYWDESL